MSEDLVLKHGLIYIPNDDELKLQVLRSCHDSPTSGHLGQDKTLELASRNYFWPRMRQYINKYIQSCDTCARNRPLVINPTVYYILCQFPPQRGARCPWISLWNFRPPMASMQFSSVWTASRRWPISVLLPLIFEYSSFLEMNY